MQPVATKAICAQTSWGVLLLRLFMSWIFIEAGAKKVFGFFGGPGLDGFAGLLEKIGILYPRVFSPVVAWAELVCGVLLLFGLFTRFASLIVAMIMVVAIVKVHPTNFHYPGLVLASALVLLNLGGGFLSLDNRLGCQS